MTAARQLTVHNAQITTATVQVKTLTISGKQVTLAVFRQLPEEPLISDDGHLNGVPWGVVNYHPDKCADGPRHGHVVWQRGQELLRSAVTHAPPFGNRWDGCEPGDQFLTRCVRDRLRGGTPYFGGQPPMKETNWVNEGRGLVVNMDPAPIAVKAANAVTEASCAAETAAKYPGEPYFKERAVALQGEAEEKLTALDRECELIGASAADLFDAYKACLDKESERRLRHVDVRKALADLPQLFIAV